MKNVINCFLLLLFSLGSTIQLNAQSQRQVTGRVIDASTNEPLIGATVWIKESASGTVTDIDGNFVVNVESENAIISVSYIYVSIKNTLSYC